MYPYYPTFAEEKTFLYILFVNTWDYLLYLLKTFPTLAFIHFVSSAVLKDNVFKMA